ncbi:hypothetical protein ACWEVD_09800 [Nocardia thailandica]
MTDESAAARTELTPGVGRDTAGYLAARDDVLTGLTAVVLPELVVGAPVAGAVTIGELADAGALTVLESSPALGRGSGNSPMLTPKDVRLDRDPSSTGDPGIPGAVSARADDLLVVLGNGSLSLRVVDAVVLIAPGVTVVRVNPEVVDRYFLAGVLRAAADRADGQLLDVYPVAFPRMPIGEQAVRGAAVAQLIAAETAFRRQRTAFEQLLREGFGGLASGELKPAGDSARG